jgi:single-stranded-DNA-specific exonuclease
VKQNNSDGIAAIGFGLGDKIELTKPSIFSSCFCIDENEWKGN